MQCPVRESNQQRYDHYLGTLIRDKFITINGFEVYHFRVSVLPLQ